MKRSARPSQKNGDGGRSPRGGALLPDRLEGQRAARVSPREPRPLDGEVSEPPRRRCTPSIAAPGLGPPAPAVRVSSAPCAAAARWVARESEAGGAALSRGGGSGATIPAQAPRGASPPPAAHGPQRSLGNGLHRGSPRRRAAVPHPERGR